MDSWRTNDEAPRLQCHFCLEYKDTRPCLVGSRERTTPSAEYSTPFSVGCKYVLRTEQFCLPVQNEFQCQWVKWTCTVRTYSWVPIGSKVIIRHTSTPLGTYVDIFRSDSHLHSPFSLFLISVQHCWDGSNLSYGTRPLPSLSRPNEISTWHMSFSKFGWRESRKTKFHKHTHKFFSWRKIKAFLS